MIGPDGNPVSRPADTLSYTGGYLRSIHLEMSSQTPGPKLTPKQRRRAAKKQRRKEKRSYWTGPFNTIETLNWPPHTEGRNRWRMVPQRSRDNAILAEFAAKIRDLFSRMPVSP